MANTRASTNDGSTNPFFKAAKEATAADGDTTLPSSSIFADAAPKETVEGDKEGLHAEEELPEAEPDQAEYWTMRVGASGPSMQLLLDATMDRINKAFGPGGIYTDVLTQPPYHEYQAKD